MISYFCQLNAMTANDYSNDATAGTLKTVRGWKCQTSATDGIEAKYLPASCR